MAAMLGDVRFALRALRRNPGFTGVVVLTLGLGVGINTAVYSVIHGTLLQALPYRGGGEGLVQLRQPAAAEGNADIRFSVPEILAYREGSSTLDEVAEHHQLRFNLVGVGEPLRVVAGVVSANYFDMLGVEPLHGRLFLPDDDRPDASAVIVLTHDFWMSRMGGDPGAVGRTVEMNDLLHTVIGVLPPVPLYPDGADIYIPTSACPFRSGPNWTGNRSARAMRVFGRMRDPAAASQLEAELTTLAEAMHAEFPETYPERRRISTTAVPLRDALVEDGRSAFLILFATSGLVLLIAVANVANLTFARLVRRERELSLRSALGAGRHRILELVLAESAILGVAGGALGLLLAGPTVGLLTDLAARYTPRAAEIDLHGPVLLFTLVVALGAGVTSGLLPTLFRFRRWRGGLALSAPGGTEDGRKRRVQGGLVVGQVALSFVLLMAAGLTIRSLSNLYGVDPGFSTDEVLSMEIPAPFNRTAAESSRFYADLLAEVRTLPSVEEASVVMTFPLDGLGQMATSVQVRGREVDPGDAQTRADVRTVTSGYLRTMGIPVVRGRDFTEEDQLDAASVAIVNEAFARNVFEDEEALGREVSWDGGTTWLTVVGIAGDVHHYGMADEVELEIYQPTMTMMNSLLVRTSAAAGELLRPITAIVASLDPEQPVTNVATMGERRRESLAPARLITTLLGVFASLAALITAAGIGGLISFNVSQRTKELGIRIALGSSRARVLGILLRHGLGLTLAGLVIGGVAAVSLGRFVESFLFGVQATDPWTFFLVSSAFLLIAVLAALVPARRLAGIRVRDVLTSE